MSLTALATHLCHLHDNPEDRPQHTDPTSLHGKHRVLTNLAGPLWPWPPYSLPGPSVRKTQMTKNSKPRPPTDPKRLKNHPTDFRCAMKKFTLTLETLRRCVQYNSALVIQVVKYCPFLWVLHMMVLHQSLQVD